MNTLNYLTNLYMYFGQNLLHQMLHKLINVSRGVKCRMLVFGSLMHCLSFMFSKLD